MKKTDNRRVNGFFNDIRDGLSKRPKAELVNMLVDRALEDDGLLRKLVLKTAKPKGKKPRLAAYRAAIDNAIGEGYFVNWREAYDYTNGVEAVVDSIEDLLKAGYATEVIELAEYALAGIEKALSSMDDSSGAMSEIRDRAQAIHLAACRAARPDQVTLAKRLFHRELNAEWDTFSGAAQVYAGVLGEKGLAVYGKLAEAQWAKVPALGPGSDKKEKYKGRFRITQIMETLAKQSGDVEELVAVKKRDLSSSYDFLEIAEIYGNAGKHDLAMEWVENGIKVFPGKPDGRLIDFLAEEYHRRRRHSDALALIWTEFKACPGLSGYQKLKNHADRGGSWGEWRGKAFEFLRAHAAARRAEAQKGVFGRYAREDYSSLVEVHLWEKNLEAAWKEAKEGGCSDTLWLKLAALREKEHPEDALPIYKAQVETVLDLKNEEAYRQAAAFLGKIRSLLGSLGRPGDFAGYLASVSAAHKAKRNFMKILARKKWK